VSTQWYNLALGLYKFKTPIFPITIPPQATDFHREFVGHTTITQ